MSKQFKGACIFGQSGGPTAVINASMYGVVSAALASENITRVYGAQYGIKGVLEDKLFDMGAEDAEELKLLLNTPSSELGSCRYKIADPEEDDSDYKRIIAPATAARQNISQHPAWSFIRIPAFTAPARSTSLR